MTRVRIPIGALHKMKIIKILNHAPKNLFKEFLLDTHYLLGKTFLKKYLPLRSLYLEVTSCCNLKCKGCYRTLYNYESKNKNISLEDFKRYVDQVPSSSSLYLHGLGEPSLHPNIKEILEYAKEHMTTPNE